MNIEDLRTLVQNNKTEESIEFLKKFSVGPLKPFLNSLIILRARFDEFNKNQIVNIPQVENLNSIHKTILDIAEEMADHAVPTEEIENLIESRLLLENSFPFIDRKKFRTSIQKKLATDKAHIFLVSGQPKSGMSHLEKFLKNLSENLKVITLIPCDIPQILDEPNMHLGEKLAKFISFSMNMEVNFDDTENAQFKFIQFINKLKEKIRSENRVPVFFLHDFHKINERNENLLEFIFMLITSINSDFPKSIFIVAGLNFENLRNWHNDLRFTTEIYKMESVKIEDLKRCLSIIYEEYKGEIQEKLNQPITKEEYLEQMVQKLTQEGEPLNIKTIGESLSDHLFTLKS
ncbi:MAG: hypothetical protein P1U56_13575 [Saprospiraceae bacterium]|nr:hypothetical protein [Saprospiraceae bacterium]